MAVWRPSPRMAETWVDPLAHADAFPFGVDEDEPDYFAEAAALLEPEGEDDSFGGRLAASFAARPIQAPPITPYTSQLGAFLTRFAAGTANRMGDAHKAKQESPTIRLAKARMKVEQAQAAQKAREENTKRAAEAAKLNQQSREQANKPADYSKPQPGEDYATFRKRQIRELSEDAAARRGPEKPEKALPKGQLTEDQAKSLNQIRMAAQADKDVSEFQWVRDAYSNGTSAASRKNSAGDIVLMRMVARASDPGSTVREEEFNTFKSAQGTLARYGVKLTTEMWGTGGLNDYGRKIMKDELESIYRNKETAHKNARDHYFRLADALGVPRELAFRDYIGGVGAAPATASPEYEVVNGVRLEK